jgi:hypothetical protein
MVLVKIITLYYDSYEKNFGDGFYPQTTFVQGYESINIQFNFTDGCWQQSSGDPITGFDGNERKNILNLLNHHNYISNNILDTLGYLI